MLYKKSDSRRLKEEKEEKEVGRNAFRRDFGRLLHSPSFRRLQGKTQLFPGHESDFFRNRLTHSLEVAQIAKGIAQMINSNNPAFSKNKIDLDLIEFAGLAHDLGHPPFGHNGELALDECMRKNGGFEGNAQTLRILSKVEKKVFEDIDAQDSHGISVRGRDRRLGLNLTFRSLASILKYDKEIKIKRRDSDELEKGYYASERDLVAKIKEAVGSPPAGSVFKTIECQIMDIADDIAYSTYDLEDGMKGGFSHPMQLAARVFGDAELFAKLLKKVQKEVPDVEESELYSAAKDLLILDGDSPVLEQYAQSKLLASNGNMRTAFSSDLVSVFIRGISVAALPGSDQRFAQLVVDRPIKLKIEMLKHLNYLLTIMSPKLKVVEYRGGAIVKKIFDALDSDNGADLMPDDLRVLFERSQETDVKKRLICDFIAGMTDRYAVEFYSRLNESGASIFKPL